MKRILIALALVALVAVPVFASTQNVKVSGSIDSTFIVRDQFTLGQDNNSEALVETADAYQNFLITQTLVRIDADLTDNVGTTVQLINERSWEEPSAAENIRLDLAYVTLKEMLYAPLSVTVGRQVLRYGNAFIIGDRNTNNIDTSAGLDNIAEDLGKEKAFDAIKLVLDYHPLTIDIIAAKVSSGSVLQINALKDDVDLYGINANYQLGDKWNSVLESYFFARIGNSTSVCSNAASGCQADTVYAPGLRASINPIKGLNVQAEGAWQGGNKATTSTGGAARNDNLKRNALAGQLITNYQLPFKKTEKYKPVTQTVYTYLSGESTPNDRGEPNPYKNSKNEWNGWDPMFEDQGGGTIYNTLFDLTNAHILSSSIQAKPIEDVTAKFTSTWIWLQREIDFPASPAGFASPGIGSGTTVFNMRQPDGATTPQVTSNKDVGMEFDADFKYDYTEDVQLGFSCGWFFPGEFFSAANNDTAKQFIANVDVKF